MDDHNDKAETSGSEERFTDRHILPPHINDWFLATLVQWANDYSIETGVTLSVGGAIISGVIISGSNYFKEFGLRFASSMTGVTDDVKKSFGEMLSSYSRLYDEPEGEESEDYPLPDPSYIHLKNARLYSPGGYIPADTDMLWRGKIAAVDGFWLGSLSPD